MTTWLRLVLLVLKAVWRWHFHIPRGAYAAALMGGVLVAVVGPSHTPIAFAAAVLLFLGSQGLARWWWYSHPAPRVAVARFASDLPSDSVSGAIQREIVTALQDRLGEPHRILPLPVTVGRDRRGFALRLWARLRATYVLYGDVRAAADRGSVYPRLVRPTGRYIEHWDWFTNDRTPQRTLWRATVDRLTPTWDAEDVEYPYGFAREVEALVRGLEGSVWVLLGQPKRATNVLQEALAIAGGTDSPAVDQIRIALADALAAQGQTDGALRLLRQRAREESASPELLRTLASYLVAEERPPEERRREAIELLRRAAADRQDPLLDVTLYHLAQQLSQVEGGEDEAHELFQELLASRGSHYSRAWYVMRGVGVWHWKRAVELMEAGRAEEARREARLAARWYTRALRRRPKVRWVAWGSRPWMRRPRRILPSPRMFANACDAHRLAGQAFRWRYYCVRTSRLRTAFARSASAAMERRAWDEAYAYFEWAWVGYRDPLDLFVAASAAVAAEQRGDLLHARELWHKATIQDRLGARAVLRSWTDKLALRTSLA
jgi:tetratricopeptide (TPR) repeat protein